MTIKRLILTVLTLFAIMIIGQDLFDSFSQPQIQSRLELYQTNLVLQATELPPTDSNTVAATKALVGNDPIAAALKQYQEVRQQAQKNLNKSQGLLKAEVTQSDPAQVKQFQEVDRKLERLIGELDLNIGVLQTQQNQVDTALKTWTAASQPSSTQNPPNDVNQTAQVLTGLWSKPPQLLPEAESSLKKSLDGWFEYRALTQLYQLQQRQDALQELQIVEQSAAEQAFQSLAIVGAVPIVSCLIGVGILLFLIGQWLIQRKQALLSADTMPTWTTPWDGETIWQVLIVGFFLVAQLLRWLVLPVLVVFLKQSGLFDPATATGRAEAVFALVNYLLLAIGGLSVLYLSIKPFLPLPDGWFRIDLKGNWFWWGLGGYFAALPLVILISAINQQIWQGQGGSNPILPIVLAEKDGVALLIFFVTAAIAAPIFEEILFRGFLLTSLTRYLPTWGAIALSSVIFAVAHLSLSEVLPLTVLGMVLGFVYVRSGNLLSSMLLHGLWNSGTLLSLFVLGSGQR